MSDTLKIVSYNVRGSSPYKRGSLWQELRRLAAEVIFLQEMHFVAGSIPRLPLELYDQWFHAPPPLFQGQGGVAIAFQRL